MEPGHHSTIAGTADSKEAIHHSQLAVTARVEKMIYTYIAKAEAVTCHALGDLGVFGARDGSLFGAYSQQYDTSYGHRSGDVCIYHLLDPGRHCYFGSNC